MLLIGSENWSWSWTNLLITLIGIGLTAISFLYQHRIFETLINFYSRKTRSDARFHNQIKAKQKALSRAKYPIVYHQRYNVTAWGLEKQHSFDSQKYGKIMTILTQYRILSLQDVHKPGDPSRTTLLQVFYYYYHI